MNSSSLTSGPFSSNKKQHLKEAAYIDFLKSFSQNGLITLEKLESQFNKHYDPSTVKEDFKVFQKIRTLVSSYEVFVIEIHDSCEFIEVPEFGTCILKVFIQLIGILKWTLQFLINQQKSVQPQNSHPLNIPRSASQQNTSSYNSKSTPTASRRDSHIRNTYAPNAENLVKESKCSQCGGIKIQQNDQNIQNICKLKQKTSLQLKDINEEISRISHEFAEEEKAQKKQDIEKDQIHRFMRKREEAQKTYLKMGLGEQSKNEEILSEILITLSRKGEAIKRFADLRMNSLGETNKNQQPAEEDYETFKHQLEVDITQKVSSAKHKLYNIFKEHLAQHQKSKQSQLVDAQVQIDESETAKLKKFYSEKQNKKFKTEINRLQKELENQKALNQSLQQILKNKSHQYEAEVMKYRNELITLEAKSKKDLKTLSKLKNQQNTLRNLKKMTSIIDNSNSSDGRSLGSVNLSPTKTEQQQEEDEDQPKFLKIKGFLKGKKRHQKGKNFTMFQPISDKSESLNLQSPAFEISFVPDPKPLFQIIQIVKTQKSLPKKQPQIDVQCQTTNDLLQKYLYALLQKQAYNKTKTLAKTFTTPKSPNDISNSKSNTNIMSYSKKGSSYMGNLANYYEIQTNSIQNTNRETLCSRLYPKSSMVVQRPFDSSIKDKQIKNDFIPIFGKDQDVDFIKYKKKYFRDTNTLKTLRNSNFITNSKSNKNSFGEIKPSNQTSPSQSFRFPVQIFDDSDLQNTVEKQIYHKKRLKRSRNIHDSQEQMKSIKNQNCLGFDTENQLKNGSRKSLKVNSSLNMLPDFSKVKMKSKRPSNVQKIVQDFVYENKV